MAFKKRMKCPKCCPNHPIPFYKTTVRVGDLGASREVWECGNCIYTKEVGKKKTPKLYNGMTKRQLVALERLAYETWQYASLGDVTRIEVKNIDVKVYDRFVSVVFEYGLKNDEGSMASIFGRDRWHLFIGKKGAVTVPGKKVKGGLSMCIIQGKN